ncbi:MAG: hypothetical protein JO219_06980 [Candidatus Eremiobacteraeota bacterium]|nr:hypothetical protein [Candidatus Eremiobacteraeota bacterium]
MHRLGLSFVAFALVLAASARLGAAATTTTTNTTQSHPQVQLAAIPTPANLRAIPLSQNQLPTQTEKDQCYAHGGGGHCTDPYPFRSYVLIWDFTNLSAVDGFRFYQVSGGRTMLSDIPTRVPQTITWAAWGKRAGTCFVVTAYQGSRESADSNKFCIPFLAPQSSVQMVH